MAWTVGIIEVGTLPDTSLGAYVCGALDDVIPPALVSRSEAYLRGRSGADTTQAVYDHAHSISLPEIREIGAWLEARA